MNPIELKVARIGNSRGVRIPAKTLERYRIGGTVLMEERSDGILLRPLGAAAPKLSWEETARETSAAREDWSSWETAVADGMNDVPWQPGKRLVAERGPKYRGRQRRGKR